MPRSRAAALLVAVALVVASGSAASAQTPTGPGESGSTAPPPGVVAVVEPTGVESTIPTTTRPTTAPADDGAAIEGRALRGILTRSVPGDDVAAAAIPARLQAPLLTVRLALAVDALVELDAFAPDEDPAVNDLVADIGATLGASGLDRDGYRRELRWLASDLPTALAGLVASGVEPSADLRRVAEALGEELLPLVERGSASVADPVDWSRALADLVVRGGAAPAAGVARAGDAAAVLAHSEDLAGRIDQAGAARGGTTATVPATTAAGAVDPSGVAPDASSGGTPTTGAAGVGVGAGSGGTPTTGAAGVGVGAGSGAADVEAAATGPGSEEASGVGEGAGVGESAGSGSLPALLAGAVAGALLLGGILAVLRLRRGPVGTAPSDTDPDPGAVTPGAAPAGHGGGARSSTPPTTGRDVPLLSLGDLVDVGRRMTSALDADAIAVIAIDEARRVVGADGGALLTRDDRRLVALRAEPASLFDLDDTAGSSLCRVIETGRSSTVVAADEPILAEVPMAMAAVPIVADGAVIGALTVVRVASRPFDRNELEALETLAPLVGSSLQAAAAHDSAAALADADALTGLANRRRLDADLNLLDDADVVAVVMVDVDHFKTFNDRNGHQAGDEALRRVAAVLVDSVRPADSVYRYGGEEFLLLLPTATTMQAAAVAERARAAVAGADIPGGAAQPGGAVTISVGVAGTDSGTIADLVERADRALYRAKEAGRNRVLADGVPTGPV